MATTTLKLDACSFSELKIYPGRGSRCITKDGKTHMFLNVKTANLFHARKKAVKLRWSQAWRRLNKKLRSEQIITRRRVRRAARVEKAVAGMSLEEMKKTAAAIKRTVPGATEAAIKEAKARREAQRKTAKQGGLKKGQGGRSEKAAKHAPALKPLIRT